MLVCDELDLTIPNLSPHYHDGKTHLSPHEIMDYINNSVMIYKDEFLHRYRLLIQEKVSCQREVSKILGEVAVELFQWKVGNCWRDVVCYTFGRDGILALPEEPFENKFIDILLLRYNKKISTKVSARQDREHDFQLHDTLFCYADEELNNISIPTLKEWGKHGKVIVIRSQVPNNLTNKIKINKLNSPTFLTYKNYINSLNPKLKYF